MLLRRVVLLSCIALAGCALVDPPAGQETVREFAQETRLPYRDAYQIIARQMKSCHRMIGLLGTGYEIQSDLDSAASTGRVELFYIGLMGGGSKPEDSILSRTIIIKGHPSGATVTVSGQTPRYVYTNHLAIKSWLSGNAACDPVG